MLGIIIILTLTSLTTVQVLELCSKTGLVSASVQTKGYYKVDVLNEDMPTLRSLQRNNLYRNYIWREVSGIGSTGLREESYDVVVTSGGFSSNAMSPNDITEVSKREKCFHSE